MISKEILLEKFNHQLRWHFPKYKEIYHKCEEEPKRKFPKWVSHLQIDQETKNKINFYIKAFNQLKTCRTKFNKIPWHSLYDYAIFREQNVDELFDLIQLMDTEWVKFFKSEKRKINKYPDDFEVPML